MTTYAEFQSYYLRKLWRTGDAELTADLPFLIKEAESRIKRDFRDNDLATTTEIIIEDGSFFPLPSDFRELITGSVNGVRMVQAIPMGQLHGNSVDQSGPIYGGAYTLLGRRLFVRGKATVTSPATASLTYYMDLIQFADEPDEPFYDLHPDFYISALNVVAYDWLREFELKGQNEADYKEALDSMIRTSNYARWPSGQISGVIPDAGPTGYKKHDPLGGWSNSPVTPPPPQTPEPDPEPYEHTQPGTGGTGGNVVATDYVSIYEGAKNA